MYRSQMVRIGEGSLLHDKLMLGTSNANTSIRIVFFVLSFDEREVKKSDSRLSATAIALAAR